MRACNVSSFALWCIIIDGTVRNKLEGFSAGKLRRCMEEGDTAVTGLPLPFLHHIN